MKYNYNKINYLLDDIKNKDVYFLTKDEYKIKKLTKITISKDKLNVIIVINTQLQWRTKM